MQPNQTQQQQPSHDPQHTLQVMAEGEKVICDIRRHPIGIMFTYISFGLMLVAVGVIAISAPSLLPGTDSDVVGNIGLAVLAFMSLFIITIAYIYHGIYYANRWIVTDDSLTQYEQRGIFNRQSSQLGMDSLEDVTVLKKGIMAHIFNYGRLIAETAAENSKFQFIYCPQPEKYAQQILAAHERFEEREQHKNRTDIPQQPVPTGTDSVGPR